jgi:hypothetical protein
MAFMSNTVAVMTIRYHDYNSTAQDGQLNITIIREALAIYCSIVHCMRNELVQEKNHYNKNIIYILHDRYNQGCTVRLRLP